jgi:hypothetical protein
LHQAVVTGPDCSEVPGIDNDLYSLVGGGDLAKDWDRVIRRSIINKDDLKGVLRQF